MEKDWVAEVETDRTDIALVLLVLSGFEFDR